MKKIYTKILCLSVACSFVACDDFLSEYSQDMTVLSEVSHCDELLLGSIYVPNFLVYNPSGTTSCGFFNILDDDISSAKGGDGASSVIPYNINECVSVNFGYYAWQPEVGMKHDGNRNDDHATWNDLYKRINYVNVLLDEMTEIPHETEKDDAAYYRVQGEAHFLRGQFYFILANLYGKPYHASTCAKELCVPLKLTPYVEHDNEKDTQFQRATVKEIYDQVVADLTMAAECLTKSPQNSRNRFHRASAEAANLLLSRVYLYMQEWEKADAAANEVIKSKNFRLAGLNHFESTEFLSKENPEVIFSQGQNNLPLSDGNGETAYTPLSGYAGSYCVAMDLVRLYDLENDKRANFFGIAGPGFQQGRCDSIALVYKFDARQNSTARYSDVFGMRLSEAYLNRMEACAMQNDVTTANDLLNELRSNRIDNYVDETYAGEELVNQIRDERRKELCFEGHRWFDLRRYSVNDTYPYSKPIVHVMNLVNGKGYNTKTQTYVLEPGDDAYTFAIPAKVLEFDKVSMGTNNRPKRQSLEELNPDEGGSGPNLPRD